MGYLFSKSSVKDRPLLILVSSKNGASILIIVKKNIEAIAFPRATKPKQQGQPQVVDDDTTRNVTCTTIGALAAFPPTCYFPAFQSYIDGG